MFPIQSSGVELLTALCLDLKFGSDSSSLYSAHISLSEEERDRTGSYSTEWMVLVITALFLSLPFGFYSLICHITHDWQIQDKQTTCQINPKDWGKNPIKFSELQYCRISVKFHDPQQWLLRKRSTTEGHFPSFTTIRFISFIRNRGSMMLRKCVKFKNEVQSHGAAFNMHAL